MKTRFIFIFMIFALILAACQPATPPPTTQPTETPTGNVTFEDSNAEVTSAPEGDFPRPEVTWNHDPNTLIVSGTYCCGFTTPLVPLNYIPDFQVWGDGRYVWVVYSSDNSTRKVLQGQLSEEKLTTLLQKVVDAGFFGWKDRYANPMISDLADQCMTVNLSSTSKTVCEYSEGAPEAFHTFYDNFARGNEETGIEYVPTKGYLTAFDMGNLGRPVSQSDVQWPADQLFSLSTAVDKGVWVEGQALELAWQAVNNDPWQGLAYENGKFYSLAIQIPGLSMNQPPADNQ